MPSCQELFNLFLVLRAGIEPACPCERKILSLLCLPISPPEHRSIIQSFGLIVNAIK